LTKTTGEGTEEYLATFFLIVLLVASGSFFGRKAIRAHRGEPWVAAETFKSNMSLIGPHGVNAASRRMARRPSGRPRDRVASRPGASAGRGDAGDVLSAESLQFALALLVAASAFTFVCALLGMLPWELTLGTVAATGLFVAFLLESRESRRRVDPKIAYIREYIVSIEGEENDPLYAEGFG
jgi:hypothetical protein